CETIGRAWPAATGPADVAARHRRALTKRPTRGICHWRGRPPRCGGCGRRAERGAGALATFRDRRSHISLNSAKALRATPHATTEDGPRANPLAAPSPDRRAPPRAPAHSRRTTR